MYAIICEEIKYSFKKNHFVVVFSICSHLFQRKFNFFNTYIRSIGNIGDDNNQLSWHIARQGYGGRHREWPRTTWSAAEIFHHIHLAGHSQCWCIIIQIDCLEYSETHSICLIEFPWTFQCHTYGISDVAISTLERCGK